MEKLTAKLIEKANQAHSEYKAIEKEHMAKLVDLAGEIYEELKELEKAYNKVSCELKKYCKKEGVEEVKGNEFVYRYEQYEVEVVDPVKLYDKYGRQALKSVSVLVTKARELFGDGYKEFAHTETRERGKIERKK